MKENKNNAPEKSKDENVDASKRQETIGEKIDKLNHKGEAATIDDEEENTDQKGFDRSVD